MLVLITRSGEEAEELAGLISPKGSNRGLKPMIEPMMTPHFLRDGDLEINGAQGFLVTSTNGARALARATGRRDLPVYVMGAAAARTLGDAGFDQAISTSGDGGDLVLLFKDILNPAKGGLIHATGTSRAAELQEAVEDEGFGFRHETLFETSTPDALSDDLRAAIDGGELKLILFYSPLSVGVFISLVEQAGLAEACASITLLCLSNGVANAARPITWRQVLVPPEPNQNALLECLDGWAAESVEA